MSLINAEYCPNDRALSWIRNLAQTPDALSWTRITGQIKLFPSIDQPVSHQSLSRIFASRTYNNPGQKKRTDQPTMQRQDLHSSFALFETNRSVPLVDDPTCTLTPTHMSPKKAWLRLPRRGNGGGSSNKNEIKDKSEPKETCSISSSKTPETFTEFSVDSHSPPPPPTRRTMRLQRPIPLLVKKSLKIPQAPLNDLFDDGNEESEDEEAAPYPPPCPFASAFVVTQHPQEEQSEEDQYQYEEDDPSEGSMDEVCLARFEDSFSIHSSFASVLSSDDLEASFAGDWDTPSFGVTEFAESTSSHHGSARSCTTNRRQAENDNTKLRDARQRRTSQSSSSGRRSRHLRSSHRQSRRSSASRTASAEVNTALDHIHQCASPRRRSRQGIGGSAAAVRAQASVAGTTVLRPTYKVLAEDRAFPDDAWSNWF